MDTLLMCLLVLGLLALSGLASRHLPVPTPFVQIVLGALASWPVHGLHVALDPAIFLLLFIAPLLFVDALRIPKRELVRERVPVVMLALGLVLFTVLGVGYLVHGLAPYIPLPAAFALAAVLSPTDAVALGAITARSPVPKRMKGILKGEALLNDASGLVTFKFALAATLTGAFSLGDAAVSLLVVSLGGLLVGAAMAFVMNWVLGRVGGNNAGTTATDNLLLILLPFAAYLLAEHVGASGILAAVAAGIAMDRTTFFARGGAILRVQGRSIWSMVEFVFNGIIFLLLGFYLPPSVRAAIDGPLSTFPGIGKLLVLMGAITAALITLRFLWVSVMRAIERLLPQRRRTPGLSSDWRTALAASLGGMRGAIALAGILSVPQQLPDGTPFPSRDLLVTVVVGVILCSLLLGAMALPPVLRGMPAEAIEAPGHAQQAALVEAAKAARNAVKSRHSRLSSSASTHEKEICDRVADAMIARYERIMKSGSVSSVDQADDDNDPDAALVQSIVTELRSAALKASRDQLRQAKASGRIDAAIARSVIARLDLHELSLRGGGYEV
jgi:CPA1 family monovalent cation:H+ antiporter